MDTITIDSNRIAFNDLNIEEKARDLGLLEPLKGVSSYNAGMYKAVPVDVGSPENAEPLLDVKAEGIDSIPYYLTQAHGNPTYNKDIPGAPDINFARKGTIEAMKKANALFQQLGLELVVVDGHRSPVTQDILFKAFQEKFFEQKGCGLSQQTKANAETIWPERARLADEAKEFALNFCSSAENFDPSDPQTWTIHSTGGAVDVYLRDKNSGKIVDMGEDYFDNPADVTHTNYYENKLDKTPAEMGYMKARRVLYNAMTAQGFVNYGNECFHFSFQDQYWGLVKGWHALYGYKPSPKDLEALSRQTGNAPQQVKG